MSNKYAWIHDPQLLKSRKPRKKLSVQGPDLSNFLTNNVDLKKIADFGLEMLKFLPKHEQWMYKNGKVLVEAGAENGVSFEHGGEVSYANEEWWDLFNEYEISESDIEKYGLEGLTDDNEDGRLTNADTILWAEEYKDKEDGYTDGVRTNWISGQQHRSGVFYGTGSEGDIAGQGTGISFKNIDFMVESSEWNHIYQKGGTTKVDSAADMVARQAYYINDALAAAGKSWSALEAMLSTKFPGKSFYDIVMDPAQVYQSLSNEDAFLLLSAMYEARERAWGAMTEIFGPVTSTHDDQAMIANMEAFIKGINYNKDYQAISLLPFFLYIQHSFTNRMTTFYEQATGKGFDRSVLDKERFWNFSQWSGRLAYNYALTNYSSGIAKDSETYRLIINTDNTADLSDIGKLYKYRDDLWKQYTSSSSDGDTSLTGEEKKKLDAVDALIDNWFGATEASHKKPKYDEHAKDPANIKPAGIESGEEADNGTWIDIGSSNITAREYSDSDGDGTDWEYFTASKAFIPNVEDAWYGWDRKWQSKLFVKDADGVVIEVYADDKSWAQVQYDLWARGKITSRLNPLMDGLAHPHYAAGQFFGLNPTSLSQGKEYNANWFVHAEGLLEKYGAMIGLMKVMSQMSQKRQNSAEYKEDKKDYKVREEELAYEQQQEAIAAQKAQQSKQKQLKSAQKKTSAPAPSSQTSRADDQKNYQKAMEKYLMRMFKQHSAKTKAFLKKAAS